MSLNLSHSTRANHESKSADSHNSQQNENNYLNNVFNACFSSSCTQNTLSYFQDDDTTVVKHSIFSNLIEPTRYSPLSNIYSSFHNIFQSKTTTNNSSLSLSNLFQTSSAPQALFSVDEDSKKTILDRIHSLRLEKLAAVGDPEKAAEAADVFKLLATKGSRLTTIQRAFDVFMVLDMDHDLSLGVEDLDRGINMFHPSIHFDHDEVAKIFKIADITNNGRLYFAEFYSIFACLSLLESKFGMETTMLSQSQVKSALLEAGLDPSPSQLQHMFHVKSSGASITDQDIMDETQKGLDFPQLLKIYLEAPRSETELFLHSWYKAGRSNFLQHKQHFEASPMQDFVAGTAAGVALTLVGHPFDTIKVRLQTTTRFTSAYDCVMQTIRKESPLAVYRGMSGPMLTIPALNAIVFACYAQGQKFFQGLNGDPKQELSLSQITLAGMYAGLVNCVVACPVELIKTRLQTQYGSKSAVQAFKGPLDCIMHILRASGVKGLFRGMTATIYREIPGYAGQFFTYEYCKRALMKQGNRAEFELKPWELLLSGGMAGMGGWVVSYPMDLIKSQIQAEPWNKTTRFKKNKYLLDGGFWSACSQNVKKHGFTSLWKGFGVCMLRAWPANAAGFLAYESVLGAMREKGVLSGSKPKI